MKRILLIIAIAALAAGVAFGQTSLGSVQPKNARAMGMGGAFRVFSTGYDTFFGNPAGFANERGSLTLADIGMWGYVKPTQENIANVQKLMNDQASTSEMVNYIGKFITGNGLGLGASVGLGWAGRGFGLGFNLVTDEIAVGSSLLGAKLVSQTQANATVGLGFRFDLGILKLKVGADARAFYKLHSDPVSGWPFSSILTGLLNENSNPEDILGTLNVLGGYGLALDAGTTLNLGPFMLGAMVRDFGFGYKMGQASLGDIMEDPGTNLPLNGTTAYKLDPVVSMGAGFAFRLLNLIAPSIYVESQDMLAVFSDGFDAIWNTLHAGAELKLLNFISARVGLNQGYISIGAGIDLLILEVDAALFTEELGSSPGDFGRTGIAIQAAVRF